MSLNLTLICPNRTEMSARGRQTSVRLAGRRFQFHFLIRFQQTRRHYKCFPALVKVRVILISLQAAGEKLTSISGTIKHFIFQCSKSFMRQKLSGVSCSMERNESAADGLHHGPSRHHSYQQTLLTCSFPSIFFHLHLKVSRIWCFLSGVEWHPVLFKHLPKSERFRVCSPPDRADSGSLSYSPGVETNKHHSKGV